MLMDSEMDHGPLISQQSLNIAADESIIELQEKLILLASEMILPAIKGFVSGALKAVEQNHNAATYTKIIDKSDGMIHWSSESAEQVYNKYRAYIVWPGVWSKWNGSILKITKIAHQPKYSDSNIQIQDLEPGKVFEQEGKVFVKAKQGILEILEVQLEGKNKTAVAEFVRGHKDFIGSVIG